MTNRFALVGCGEIGQRHARQMSRVGKLVAVCEVDRKRAAKLAGEFGCDTFHSLDTMLQTIDSVDVISICTPNFLHAAQSILCLRAGFNVICEKPMCLSSAEADGVIAEISRSGRRFFVVKQNRFNPPVVYLKHLIDAGCLGSIHSFQVNCFWNRTSTYYQSTWKGKKELDGGILFTQFSHFVDLLIWFLGEASAVRMITGNYLLKDVIEFEDTGCALLTMQNGAIGTIHFTVTAFTKNMEGSMTIFGEKGTVKIGGQYLNTLEYVEVEGQTAPPETQSRLANDYGTYMGSMSNHDAVYEHVLRALNHKDHDLVEGIEAAKTVRLIEQLYASAKVD